MSGTNQEPAADPPFPRNDSYPWDMIEAAGGVVWRITAKGTIKVLLVHRPRYDDWSLPKGKAEPGELPLACALREVAEETGMVCESIAELPQTRYVDRKGRDKRVSYFAMTRVEGAFEPNREVDHVRWVNVRAAEDMLSYERDIAVVRALADMLRPTQRLSA